MLKVVPLVRAVHFKTLRCASVHLMGGAVRKMEEGEKEEGENALAAKFILSKGIL